MPRPEVGPGPGEVAVMKFRFGWCLDGHHEGDVAEVEGVWSEALQAHLAKTFPRQCPGIVWLSAQGGWSGCACGCHDLGELAAAPAPEAAPAGGEVA